MLQNPNKWYKTVGGSIFLAVIIMILIGGVLFLGLTGYYLWKLKFGDADKLTQEFSQRFTIDPAKKSLEKSDTVNLDLNQFIRPYTPTLGNANAPVTIISFIDFECPFCRQEYPILKKVLEKYGSVVRVIFKNTPITAIHPEALGAHLAAACAEEQNKFWPYYDLLFINQKLNRDSLFNYASQLGINNQQFQSCFETEKYLEEINQDLLDASEVGLRGTPTHIINGTKIEGVFSEKQWDKMILQALKS